MSEQALKDIASIIYAKNLGVLTQEAADKGILGIIEKEIETEGEGPRNKEEEV